MVLVATQVKRRRGTTAENDAFTGAEGEITVDLTNKELRLHTGNNKLGGYRIGRTTDRTNCITEIPQDIKLELNNGTVTLKAGSKVYVPNGQGIFDIVVTQSDLSFRETANQRYILAYDLTTGGIISNWASNTKSGSDPTGYSYGFYYNTATNKINDYRDTIGHQASFPFAVVTTDSSGVVAINRVFNGFGYIGSVIFALPNVKCFMPNGRNADGSLNNIEVTIETVKLLQMSEYMVGRQNAPLYLFQNGGLGGLDTDPNVFGNVRFLDELKDVARPYSCWYCLEDNKMHFFNEDTKESISQRAFVGCFNVDSNNIITIVRPKFAFNGLDYSDANFIARQAMPSDRQIDLVLPNSNVPIVAPSDGWIAIAKRSVNAGEYVRLINNSNSLSILYHIPQAGLMSRLYMPVSKGTFFSVDYSASGELGYFRFIYANGSK